jgi:hypothetical protein
MLIVDPEYGRRINEREEIGKVLSLGCFFRYFFSVKKEVP